MLWGLEEERVAVLVGQTENGKVRIEDIWEAMNLHANPTAHYALTRAQWESLHARAAHEGLVLVGLIHSHPPPHPDCPSGRDCHFCPLPIMAVYHCTSSTLILYDREGETERIEIRLPLSLRILNRIFEA